MTQRSNNWAAWLAIAGLLALEIGYGHQSRFGPNSGVDSGIGTQVAVAPRYRMSAPYSNRSSGQLTLPGGRRYWQGRYYGNFNNRFYGPQYGYF